MLLIGENTLISRYKKQHTKKSFAKSMIRVGEKFFYMPHVFMITSFIRDELNYVLLVLAVFTLVIEMRLIHEGLKILDTIISKNENTTTNGS